MAAVIKKCGCQSTPPNTSQYQDKRYGEGMRVMNLDVKKTDATCTVCGRTVKI